MNELSITSVELASWRELDANAAAAHVSATSAASGTSHCQCLAGEWVILSPPRVFRDYSTRAPGRSWRRGPQGAPPAAPPAAASRPPLGRPRARGAAAPRCCSGRRHTGSGGGSGSPTGAATGREPLRGARRAACPRRPRAGRPRSAPRCTDAPGRATAARVGPVSTIRPRYMTHTSSATWRTIARSCEISRSPSSSSRESRVSRFAS